MSQATFAFSDHEQIRTMFGTQDRHLRRVRDAVGVDVVVRGDELRLNGDDEQIRRGLEVFNALQAVIEKKGGLPDAEVDRILAGEPARSSNTSEEGTLQSARVGFAATSRTGYRPQLDQHANPDRRSDAEPNEAGLVDEGVNLFEKAKRVHPMSPGQAAYIDAVRNNPLVFCAGPAGSGKTYLAVAMAINALRQELVRKIVLVRPAVEAGEKLGFLPGDVFAKVNPYLRPLLDALNDMLSFEQVKRYLSRDVVEIAPLAFMRGRTLNETFMILDEAQNTTVTQMKMFLTRMGADSRIVVTGDVTQTDLPDHMSSGLTDAIGRLGGVKGVATVRLTGRDIVRHRLVRDVVRAYDQDGRNSKSRRK